MKLFINFSLAIILFTVVLSGSGCKKSDDSMTTTTPTPSFQVSLRVDPNLGQHLVDKDGRTLYIYSNDPDGKDNCTGQCQLYWPVFDVAGFAASMLGPGLDFADFDSIASAGGKTQLTYKG